MHLLANLLQNKNLILNIVEYVSCKTFHVRVQKATSKRTQFAENAIDPGQSTQIKINASCHYLAGDQTVTTTFIHPSEHVGQVKTPAPTSILFFTESKTKRPLEPRDWLHSLKMPHLHVTPYISWRS